MQAGAQGYLLKGAEQDEIVGAIRAVVSGQAIFGPGIAGRVLEYFAAPRVPTTQPFPQLTERERDILDLLASGLRTAVIAQRLCLAPKTVSNHLTNVFAKLEDLLEPCAPRLGCRHQLLHRTTAAGERGARKKQREFRGLTKDRSAGCQRERPTERRPPLLRRPTAGDSAVASSGNGGTALDSGLSALTPRGRAQLSLRI